MDRRVTATDEKMAAAMAGGVGSGDRHPGAGQASPFRGAPLRLRPPERLLAGRLEAAASPPACGPDRGTDPTPTQMPTLQSDWTERYLADGSPVAIAATLDDPSRYLGAIAAGPGDGDTVAARHRPVRHDRRVEPRSDRPPRAPHHHRPHRALPPATPTPAASFAAAVKARPATGHCPPRTDTPNAPSTPAAPSNTAPAPASGSAPAGPDTPSTSSATATTWPSSPKTTLIQTLTMARTRLYQGQSPRNQARSLSAMS